MENWRSLMRSRDEMFISQEIQWNLLSSETEDLWFLKVCHENETSVYKFKYSELLMVKDMKDDSLTKMLIKLQDCNLDINCFYRYICKIICLNLIKDKREKEFPIAILLREYLVPDLAVIVSRYVKFEYVGKLT